MCINIWIIYVYIYIYIFISLSLWHALASMGETLGSFWVSSESDCMRIGRGPRGPGESSAGPRGSTSEGPEVPGGRSWPPLIPPQLYLFLGLCVDGRRTCIRGPSTCERSPPLPGPAAEHKAQSTGHKAKGTGHRAQSTGYRAQPIL